MIDIALNISLLKKLIPPSVKIVAVSKTRPVSDIMIAYNAGHRSFGENRVQELLSKKDLLPGDIEWHLIGHLQSNKVKYIVPFISTIQSVDSSRLLTVIKNEALKTGRIIDCLLQFHIAKEETKYGFDLEEVFQLLDSEDFRKNKNVNICGVMGMATFTVDAAVVQKEFKYLRNCFNTIKEKYFKDCEKFKEISMGMSGDYLIAINEGSTTVRIGSLIFGERGSASS
ncbi:MAG: YggS family pyridoxal phosphate-dependent enzyme [Odoribacter sp.]|nr:YggS family pyridoxal phosphate-dependent enzyme [Odoribacter sp.]